MRFLITLAVCVAAIAAAPQSINDDAQRIVGGTLTTINQYPTIAAVLSSVGATFMQTCGGSIINNRSVLTAAHCLENRSPANVRVRLGSSFGSSGGTVYNSNSLILHPSYNPSTINADIAIIRSASTFSFSNVVAVASIAGSNYNAGDNAVVWAAGWGNQWFGGPNSEQLRHVQLWTVNQNVCQQRYGGFAITSMMLCAGWLDVGGVGTCQRDSGGPLYHNNIVIGVTSFGTGCGEASHPSVFARVSSFTPWIQANA